MEGDLRIEGEDEVRLIRSLFAGWHRVFLGQSAQLPKPRWALSGLVTAIGATPSLCAHISTSGIAISL